MPESAAPVGPVRLVASAARPALGQIELERVTPHLKMQILSDPKEWRNRLVNTKSHQQTVNQLSPEVFGLLERAGLMDVLADPENRVERHVLKTDIDGLWLLPPGRQASHASEALSSRSTAHMFERLTAQAPNRIVLIDSPPALAASPAAESRAFVRSATELSARVSLLPPAPARCKRCTRCT